MVFLIQPFLTGLSVGFFCLSYCFPFLASMMASEKREPRKNYRLIFDFMLGRFLGYIIFGFIFSFLGEKFQYPFFTFMSILSLILISILLLLYIAGLIKDTGICLPHQFQNKNALLMGLLMGINICPPFLMSLTYVFSLHSTAKGVLYFLIFFIASSVYFLPVFFIGLLARMKEFRAVARFSGIICSCIFIIYGCYSIRNFLIKH
ncbi:MAG: sulfite exporter TauE/SafE family protein [Candidatus Omnitrophica bacterium]|nr:sulfite exporter TauE/SafE family protein [Candidatus Omnitrophota bacterium]